MIRGMVPSFRHAALARALAMLLPPCLLVPGTAPGTAEAREGDWYVGAGASAAFLRPDADVTGFEADEDVAAGGTLFLGLDVTDRGSAQLQLHGLGEGGFESGESVDYLGTEVAMLYRFVDTRDRRRRRGRLDERSDDASGLSLYARLGLGFLSRDSDIDLENERGVYLGAGAGAELHVSPALALRAEGVYHDTDAASLSLSLVARFGPGASGRSSSRPPTPSAPALPGTAPSVGDTPSANSSSAPPAGPSDEPLPAPPDAPTPGRTEPALPDRGVTASPPPRPADGASPGAAPRTLPDDADSDGVEDAADVCPASAVGFPVRDNGCALLDGVLSGVDFVAGTAALAPGAAEQLDYLANLLVRYPEARIELLAHTDDAGSVREQSILTRARLRTMGLYLVQQRGIRSNRLVLRSLGGTRPLHGNDTPENRRRNNRVEVLENTD